MDISELDGVYMVTTTTDYQGPMKNKSDGLTEIRNGKTRRTDKSGCIWIAHLEFLNENEVDFMSIADPTEAESDFCLTDEKGALTCQPVTYRTTLRLDRKGERIRLSGKIEHGAVTTVITLMKQV